MTGSWIRLGDGPEVPIVGRSEITITLDQRPEAEAARLRALGVDPDRVIDGEAIRKEIEGG